MRTAASRTIVDCCCVSICSPCLLARVFAVPRVPAVSLRRRHSGSGSGCAVDGGAKSSGSSAGSCSGRPSSGNEDGDGPSSPFQAATSAASAATATMSYASTKPPASTAAARDGATAEPASAAPHFSSSPSPSPVTAVEAKPCWSCHHSVHAPTLFCGSCEMLQPPEERLTYFEVLGIRRPTFRIAKETLGANYRALQRLLPPDR